MSGSDRSKVALGQWGEQRALRWYLDAGYQLIDRNWRGDAGELDLIVGRADQIVFCEVKARATDRFGAPSEAVGFHKQRRIRALAAQWLRAGGRSGQVRFDVVEVMGGRVAVIENAF
jgi:putative endonuclease